jgi:hypothetical protein
LQPFFLHLRQKCYRIADNLILHFTVHDEVTERTRTSALFNEQTYTEYRAFGFTPSSLADFLGEVESLKEIASNSDLPSGVRSKLNALAGQVSILARILPFLSRLFLD